MIYNLVPEQIIYLISRCEEDYFRYRATWIWLTLDSETDASLINSAEFGDEILPSRVSGQRRYRQRRFQYNVRYIDLRPMFCDGLQIELVASLSRLFFLRHLDPRDARNNFQRDHILVSIAAYLIASDRVESYSRNKN